jgi:hypothetical protein
VLRLEKYVVLIPAAFGIAIALRKPDAQRMMVTTLLLGLMAASIAGIVLSPDAATRFIAIWFPFVAVFTGVALAAFVSARGRFAKLGRVVGPLSLAVLLWLGIANAWPLSFLLIKPPSASGVWYGDRLPHTDRLAAASIWLKTHTPDDAIYAVDFSTRMGPFFFAHRSDRQLVYDPAQNKSYCRADYVVVDEELNKGGVMRPTVGIDYSADSRIYDNGSIVIYQRQPSTSCVFIHSSAFGESVPHLSGKIAK